MRGPRRWITAAAAVAVCLGVAGAVGCARKQADAPPQAFPAVLVKTTVLKPVAVPESSEYLAMLKSRHSAILNPQVDGQVTRILVRSGDRVKAGAPLMQIDPLEQQALVASQEAARTAQKANVEYARVEWERSEKLYASGVISKQAYDQAKSTYASAEAQLEALEAQVRQQQVQLHYYRVVAPTAGIVGDIPVRVGDRVTTSTLLTTVDEAGNLELYLNVPLEQAGRLRLGETIELLDSSGKLLGQTRADFISPEVDNSSQSVLVKAAVPNSQRRLRTLQFVRARIIWGTHEGMLIPVLAVSRVGGEYFAFVVEKKGQSLVARQKVIRVGQIVGNEYEVVSGLEPGERVVVEGAQELADGVPVREDEEGPRGAAKPAESTEAGSGSGKRSN
ncbi:MAG: efflux RND transporter periplasmic adaptor subunit [Acidobacteriota bacterium]|nr:efflux RND transporter periplasmic adaptor subunit [Acidobacteriota bacterium]